MCPVLVNHVSKRRAAPCSRSSVLDCPIYSSHSPHRSLKSFVKPLPTLNYHDPGEMSTSRKRIWSPARRGGCLVSATERGMKNWLQKLLFTRHSWIVRATLWKCWNRFAVATACTAGTVNHPRSSDSNKPQHSTDCSRWAIQGRVSECERTAQGVILQIE